MQIHGDAVRAGVHAGQVNVTLDDYRDLWLRAEALGYDWVSTFDHLRPPLAGATGPCFEGTTLLAAMAAVTSRVRCGMLVTAVPFRHPVLVAGIAATLDHISGGRLELGLGAGADDGAYTELAMPLPPMGECMDLLDETCRAVRELCAEGDAGIHPKPLQSRLPIVIGGSGPRRTLRIAAEHADIWNTFTADVDAYRASAATLDEHCVAVGRDPGDVRRSVLFRAVVAETESDAHDRLRSYGGDPASPAATGWLAVGTPEQCAGALAPFVDLGARDFLLGVRTPYDHETIELFVNEVVPALRARSGR